MGNNKFWKVLMPTKIQKPPKRPKDLDYNAKQLRQMKFAHDHYVFMCGEKRNNYTPEEVKNILEK